MFVLVLLVQPTHVKEMKKINPHWQQFWQKVFMRYYTEMRLLQFTNVLQIYYNRAADVAAALAWMFRDRGIHTSKQGRGHNLKSVSGVLAVASRGSSITVRLVRVLIGVLVVFFHQWRVVPAVLRARGLMVAILPCSFVMIVLIGRHQAVAFNR